MGLMPPTRFCVRRRAGYSRPAICDKSAIVTKSAPECQVRFVLNHTKQIQCEFDGMIVTPHARLTCRNAAALRHGVPAIRTMIDRVQQQSLMIRVRAEVGLGEQSAGYGEAGLPVLI